MPPLDPWPVEPDYRVSGEGHNDGEVKLDGAGLPTLSTTAPPEFDGPPGHWSPENLLVAAAADCFILTFRGVARASRLEWERLSCEVEGVLDRADGVNRFTELTIRPVLTLFDETSRDKAQRCLEKAERACLVTNSLLTRKTLLPRIEIETLA